jgi:hypothetical protein
MNQTPNRQTVSLVIVYSERCPYCAELFKIIDKMEFAPHIQLRTVSVDRVPLSKIPFRLQAVPSVAVNGKVYKGADAFQIVKNSGRINHDQQQKKSQVSRGGTRAPEVNDEGGSLYPYELGSMDNLQFANIAEGGGGQAQRSTMYFDFDDSGSGAVESASSVSDQSMAFGDASQSSGQAQMQSGQRMTGNEMIKRMIQQRNDQVPQPPQRR